MPRKTKAELAAEREALENAEMEAMEPEQEAASLPAEEEGLETTDTTSLPEEEPQEAAIAGLLADYSAASMEDAGMEDSGEENEPEPQEKSPQEEEGEAASSANDSVSADSEPVGPPIPAQEEEPSPENEAAQIAPAASGPEAAPPRRGAREQPAPRPSFFQTDFRSLDRDLSPEQMQEWNSIYASYRSKSILNGTVVGVDDNRFEVTNPQTGLPERKTVRSLVIIGYRIKVLIPESEVWAPGEERPDYVMRGMVGAKIDYVVMQVDREGECAIASRRLALAKQLLPAPDDGEGYPPPSSPERPAAAPCFRPDLPAGVSFSPTWGPVGRGCGGSKALSAVPAVPPVWQSLFPAPKDSVSARWRHPSAGPDFR